MSDSENKGFFAKLGGWYQSTAVILLNTVLLFALINYIFSFFYSRDEYNTELQNENYDLVANHPTTLFNEGEEGKNFVREIYAYGDYSDEDINQIIRPPFVTNHPTLEFMMQPVQNKHYNVGFENMRYHAFVNEENAEQKINGSAWVFGGSTAFGFRVPDNECIAAYLDELDTSMSYINFGVPGYMQNVEVDKLLLLLKKGYRPKKVIFIDGLNDIVRAYDSHYHPMEQPAYEHTSYNWLHNIMSKRKQRLQGHSFADFMNQFSLVSYLSNKYRVEKEKLLVQDNAALIKADAYENIYDVNDVYNTNPDLHYLLVKNMDVRGAQSSAMGVQRLKACFQYNIAFLKDLSTAFGFDFAIFFQPIGVIYETNRFVTEKEKQQATPFYKNSLEAVSEIRKATENGEFEHFYDISSLDSECEECDYVDLTHYNAALNKKIASEILNKLQSPTTEDVPSLN